MYNSLRWQTLVYVKDKIIAKIFFPEYLECVLK